MDFRLLGPLEVSEQGRSVPLGGLKQRSLLALLLLHANEAVSVDRIQIALWGDDPPPTAAKSVQVHVSRLRKDLGSHRLVTRAPGYAVLVEPGELDLARFEELVGLARAADPDEAAQALREALQLFRGEPLADLAYEPFAQPHVARLHDRRLVAIEMRIDADLATGRHAELVGELEALVHEHPLRERLRAQLMLALYRAGRQSDALATYRDARRHLSQELGLEPELALRDLERAILRHDPALDPPRAPVSPVPAPSRPARRRARRLVVAGALTAAAATATAAVVVALGAGGTEDLPPSGSGVVAIDGASGRRTSLVRAETPPSNVAVGEGAVWALNTDDPSITRIDPATRKVLARFEVGGIPSDIAAGGGAVWVGKGGGVEFNSTVAIARVDPRTTRVTHTVRLPRDPDDQGWPAVGYPGIAVGEGAVWAINPGRSISRLDPADGRIVATVEAKAETIAAGDAGVWFVTEDGAVARIDPRTNRVAQTIRAGADVLGGIAVGGGAVWAAGTHEGLVWRIDPGSHPVTRTIEAGPGVSFMAFAEGAVWAANFVDGRLSRIDPRTNAVTARVPIGAAQALAAGAGSAWVSVAGVPRGGALPKSSCADVIAGGREPDVLIASDLPLQGPISAGPREMVEAIRVVLERHRFRAGRSTVGYASCDASTAQSGVFEFRKCAANANAYGAVERMVAVIGPYNSQCAAVQLPILNRAPGGPLAVISPSNTYPGLTRPVSVSAPRGGYRGEPGVFYPTGVRNFMRLGSGDDLAGTADAMLADELGLRSAYLLDAGDGALDVFVTDSFRRTAPRVGIRIAGASRFDPGTRDFAALADRVARSGADCVVIGGDIFDGADRLLKALRARLDDDVTLMAGSFGFVPLAEVLKRAGNAAHGLYLSTIDAPAPLVGATPAARELARAVGTSRPRPYVLEAAQATELALAAIARSDGSRGSVLRELRSAEVHDGILGTFRIDERGDITPAPVTILRVTGSTPAGSGLNAEFQGAVVDRILRVPAELVR